MRALIDLWGLAKFILHKTFVEPVAEGRLKETPEAPWPKGLRVVVTITTGVVLLTALTGLASAVVRSTGPLLVAGDLSLPWVAMPMLFWALVVTLSLAWVAAMHLWWPLRLLVLPAFLLLHLYGGLTAITRFPNLTPKDLVTQGVVLLALLLLALVRIKAQFRLWEFVITVILMSTLVWLQIGGLHAGFSGGDWSLELMLYWIGYAQIAAAPALILAGAAMAEILVTTVSWTARGIWHSVRENQRPRVVGGILLGALTAALIASVVLKSGNDPEGIRPVGILIGLLYLAGYALPALLVLRFAPRGRRRGVQVDPDDVAQVWSEASMPVVWLLCGYLVLILATPVPSWALAGVVCVGAVVLAVRHLRRGQVATALILTVYGSATFFIKLMLIRGLFLRETESVATAGLLAVLVLAYLLITRKLTAERLLAVATVMFVSLAYPLREYLDDPLVALLAISGPSAAIFAGLIWRQLTEYHYTRRSSRRFPVEIRVLVAMASMAVVTMAIALYALSANSGADLVGWLDSLGDSEVGYALYQATVVSGLLLAVLGREVGSIYPPVEDPGWVLVEKKGLDAPLLQPREVRSARSAPRRGI